MSRIHHCRIPGIAVTGGIDQTRGQQRLGAEWIRYERLAGNKVIVAADGRGARATRAEGHDPGQVVQTGQIFVSILRLPGQREDWGDDPSFRNP